MTNLVIADTGLLQYLILSGVIDILPKLIDRVIVPASVALEAGDGSAPGELRLWMASPPK